MSEPYNLKGKLASFNALIIAAAHGHATTVEYLIDAGADMNAKHAINEVTPLMYAARYNQVEIIKLLLEKGANLKVKDERGFTALNHAENSKATEAVELLKNYSRK